MRICLLLACASTLAACGAGAPDPVTSGSRVQASLVAAWPTAGPARQDVFSRDGAVLAVTDATGLITLHQVGSWKILARLHHAGGATSAAFASDGSALFTGGYDGTVRMWDLKTRSQVREFTGAKGTVWALDVSPDGSRLAATGEDGIIRVWNLSAPAPPLLLRGHERNVWDLRFSPDGKTLASGSFDRSARLWDLKTGRLLNLLQGHDQAVVGLAFSPNGKTLATCGDDSTIRLWRTADGAALRTIATGNHTYKLAFSPDGHWLASGGRAHGAIGTAWHQLTGGGGKTTPVHIWRVSDAALVASLPAEDDTPDVSFSPDGRWLVTSGEDNRVQVWRIRPVGA